MILSAAVSLPPQHLAATKVGARSVTLQWQLPDLLNTDLLYFEVQVTRKLDADSSPEADPEPVRAHAACELPVYEYTVGDLKPASSYSVAVMCGWGGSPARVDVTTLSEDEDRENAVVPTELPSE